MCCFVNVCTTEDSRFTLVGIVFFFFSLLAIIFFDTTIVLTQNLLIMLINMLVQCIQYTLYTFPKAM